MSEQKGSVAKNTTFYTMALVIQKVLAFVYFSLIARFMGVEQTGQYSFALSFTTLFAIFIDLGLAPVLTREIAKNKEHTDRYLANVLALKVPLAILIYLIAIGTVHMLDYSDIVRKLVYLSGIIMVFDSFTLTFWAVMRGHQRLKYESYGVIGLQLITVSIGSAVLFTHHSLLYLIGALLLGSTFNLTFSFITVIKKLHLNLCPHYEPEVLKILFKIGLPFALAGIFSRIYSSIDTVLLSTLAGDAAVGWYSIPIKITLALQFLPMAFMAALFPAMSELFVSNKDKLARAFERAMRYLMILSLPIAVGVIALARPFVIAIYTADYLNSILPLRILMISLFFLFINFPVGYLLNACNKQVTNTLNMGITVVVNVVLNIFLISSFDYVGAAIASLVSTLVLFTLGMIHVPRIVNYNYKYILANFFKSLLSSAFMGAVIYFFAGKIIAWYWMIPLGGLVYFAVLWLIGGVKKEDLRDVLASVRQ